ncbi:hypothetical protein JAAARDRAFT_50655 [Jaapia argillacea MUCL 33604]|uniref:Uncharacterized protein n=1 Tax=Jaapia argillacea MUCL 33604 TaxID=933084 RepID=A0A067PCH1_9AGAM|nr:hypothetical protein JAAARDRAFT_50655 [Jaapia argillacea MUCL 33604]
MLNLIATSRPADLVEVEVDFDMEVDYSDPDEANQLGWCQPAQLSRCDEHAMTDSTNVKPNGLIDASDIPTPPSTQPTDPQPFSDHLIPNRKPKEPLGNGHHSDGIENRDVQFINCPTGSSNASPAKPVQDPLPQNMLVASPSPGTKSGPEELESHDYPGPSNPGEKSGASVTRSSSDEMELDAPRSSKRDKSEYVDLSSRYVPQLPEAIRASNPYSHRRNTNRAFRHKLLSLRDELDEIEDIEGLLEIQAVYKDVMTAAVRLTGIQFQMARTYGALLDATDTGMH